MGAYYWAVAPYVENGQVSSGPTDPRAITPTDPLGFPCTGTPAHTRYAVNSAVFGNAYYPSFSPTALAAIPRPADTIGAYDGTVGCGPTNSHVQILQPRRTETFGASYVDGHTKAAKSTSLGTTQRFTVMGPDRQLETWKVGAAGGYYTGMTECRGVPE